MEYLATTAGLTPGEFFSAIARASFELAGNISDLIIACSFPKVVKADIQRALEPHGIETA